MEAKNQKTLNIRLSDKEIDYFKSIIKKCNSEDSKIGFNKKIFNEEEKKLLKQLEKV